VSQVSQVFLACREAILDGKLIRRKSARDKEFHFQDWFEARLEEAGLSHEKLRRNSYPDFTLVSYTEGYEIKGLAYPGRELNYDANSQVPTGSHNGRSIYYVFGRYPREAEEEYPVIDLVVCHGDFLNAQHEYVHENLHVRGFGSYGDIMIRDRKMYVAPTPFALAEGTNGQFTLIVPAGGEVASGLVGVGELVRTEAPELVVGYDFNLTTNVITPKRQPNPTAGEPHTFTAYRREGETGVVQMRSVQEVVQEQEALFQEDDGEAED
jgi:hypothetical protein